MDGTAVQPVQKAIQVSAKKKAVQGHDTRTATKKTNNENPMNAIKSIATCARQTCATGRFSVNPYARIGKLKKPLKRAVLQFLPVRKNTIEVAGNLPDSEVFSRSEFAGTGFPVPNGFGRDGLVREAGRMATSMFLTSRPPYARKNADGGLQSQVGAETMTTVNTPPHARSGNHGPHAHFPRFSPASNRH